MPKKRGGRKAAAPEPPTVFLQWIGFLVQTDQHRFPEEERTGRMLERLDGMAAGLRDRGEEVPGWLEGVRARYRELDRAGVRTGLGPEAMLEATSAIFAHLPEGERPWARRVFFLWLKGTYEKEGWPLPEWLAEGLRLTGRGEGAPVHAIPAYRVQLVRDRSVPASRRSYGSPALAADLFRAYLGDSDREQFVAIFLDTRSQVIGLHLVSVGTVDCCAVSPREVFKAALLCNAAAVVLAHNHPSGDPHPSETDVAITRALQRAAELLEIPVLDHVIVGEPGYASFLELGILEPGGAAVTPASRSALR